MCLGSKNKTPARAPALPARAPVQPEVPVGQAPTTVPEEQPMTTQTTSSRTTSNTTGLTIPI